MCLCSSLARPEDLPVHGGSFGAQPELWQYTGQLKHFVKNFGAVLASSQNRLQWEHFEILLDEENSTGSPPPEKVWDG